MKDNYVKENPDDRVAWKDDPETIGEFWFKVDDGKEYNLYRDYPHELTEEERKIFDSENPEWAEYFKERREK